MAAPEVTQNLPHLSSYQKRRKRSSRAFIAQARGIRAKFSMKSEETIIQEFLEMVKYAQEETGCQIIAAIQTERLGEAVLSKPVLRVVVDQSRLMPNVGISKPEAIDKQSINDKS